MGILPELAGLIWQEMWPAILATVFLAVAVLVLTREP